MDVQIVFTPPDKKTHGFLRRQRKAIEFQNLLKKEQSVELIDAMVEFLSDFVTVPETKEAKIEALWEASQEQFESMLQALTGMTTQIEKEIAEANPTPTPTS
jgi:DNA repair exonuclease SbcCD ATPase subunit